MCIFFRSKMSFLPHHSISIRYLYPQIPVLPITFSKLQTSIRPWVQIVAPLPSSHWLQTNSSRTNNKFKKAQQFQGIRQSKQPKNTIDQDWARKKLRGLKVYVKDFKLAVSAEKTVVIIRQMGRLERKFQSDVFESLKQEKSGVFWDKVVQIFQEFQNMLSQFFGLRSFLKVGY